VSADAAFTIATAGIALFGALLAVSLRNIFHNILGFALSMLGVAGLLLSLGADFPAAVVILVYVGAVAIAMVYAVMLSHPLDQAPRPRRPGKIAGAMAVGATAAVGLYAMVRSAPLPVEPPAVGITAADLGRRLLGDYVLAFELISVLLVVAMIGAVMVARRAREGRGRW